MKKILMTGLLFLASNWFKRFSPYPHATMELTKLKIAMGYLQTIRTLRLLSISFLGAGICLVLLLSGIILFHLAIFFYTPWSLEIKMAITLGCAGFYILSAAGVFIYIFSEDRWMKIFNADKMIDVLSPEGETAANNNEERTQFARNN